MGPSTGIVAIRAYSRVNVVETISPSWRISFSPSKNLLRERVARVCARSENRQERETIDEDTFPRTREYTEQTSSTVLDREIDGLRSSALRIDRLFAKNGVQSRCGEG